MLADYGQGGEKQRHGGHRAPVIPGLKECSRSKRAWNKRRPRVEIGKPVTPKIAADPLPPTRYEHRAGIKNSKNPIVRETKTWPARSPILPSTRTQKPPAPIVSVPTKLSHSRMVQAATRFRYGSPQRWSGRSKQPPESVTPSRT